MREKHGCGTSQRGVKAGKPINNIPLRRRSVRNRTLCALFPDGVRSAGNAACSRDGCGRGLAWAAQKMGAPEFAAFNPQPVKSRKNAAAAKTSVTFALANRVIPVWLAQASFR
jgi:hypothetical protein